MANLRHFKLFLKQVLGFVFFIFTCAMVFGFVLLIQQYLKTSKSTEIAHLLIQGDLHQVGLRSIQEQVNRSVQGDLLSLDVERVRGSLEFLPWVYRVSVRKRWPDSLVVYLQEQEAVAHWNDKFYLNKYDEIFQAPALPGQKPLISLYGEDMLASEIVKKAKQFQEMLGKINLHVNKVRLTYRHAWEITLQGGVILYIGQYETLGRLQRFVTLYPQLEDLERIEYIDLRYDTGLAVGWIQNKKGSA